MWHIIFKVITIQNEWSAWNIFVLLHSKMVDFPMVGFWTGASEKYCKRTICSTCPKTGLTTLGQLKVLVGGGWVVYGTPCLIIFSVQYLWTIAGAGYAYVAHVNNSTLTQLKVKFSNKVIQLRFQFWFYFKVSLLISNWCWQIFKITIASFSYLYFSKLLIFFIISRKSA